MHKVFGVKENGNYFDRQGAYLIPIVGNKVGVVETPKGYFLLGGGTQNGESDEQCIKRECLEEIGYSIDVIKKICSAETYCQHKKIGKFHPIQVYYAGNLLQKSQEPVENNHKLLWIDYEIISKNMYSEMQNWAIIKAYETILKN